MSKGDILVLVGTRKGLFIFSSGRDRSDWKVAGPHWAGSDIFHAVYDSRGEGTMWVVRNDPVFGSEIHRSADLGATWQSSRNGPEISSDPNMNLNRLWHLTPGREDEPEVAYLGAEPASLFKTEDGGETWGEVEAITSHPTRDQWFPGAGGLCLQRIVLDPDSATRMWVGVSAAGVFGTDDGGATWSPKNNGVRADFLPETFPEVGQCPHKLLSHPARPQALYQQNHCGVFLSDNGGNEWIDISEGLPSRFGLALTLHPQDPDTFYVLPEDNAIGDQLGGGVRFVTDAKFRVFRTRNGGGDWEPLTEGLP